VVGVLTDHLYRADRVFAVALLGCAGLLFLAARWCESEFPKMDEAYRAAAAGQRVAGRPVLDHPTDSDAVGGLTGPAPVEPTRKAVRDTLAGVNDDPAVRATAAATFVPLFGLMLAYCTCLQLALTLTTVITLRSLPDPGRQFTRVRLWGTVGWVAAGNAVGVWLAPVSPGPLYLAAGATAAVALYGLTLPRTAPLGKGRTVGEMVGLPALRLFRDRSFVVFTGAAFCSAALNQFYVVYGHRYLTDLKVPRPVQFMTVAQVVEVGCMFAIPLLNPRRNLKLLMAVGLGGYALRGAVLYAEWLPGVKAVGVPMHGWGYAFFFMMAALYLDREAPPHLRASAQGIVTFVAGGLGPWAGNLTAAAVVDRYRDGTVIDWPGVWLVAFAGNAVLFVAFVLLFRPPEPDRTGGTHAG
jgi:hypothetical protein